MWQLDFAPWKAQACDKYILLFEKLKYVTIRLYSVNDTSMGQLCFTPCVSQLDFTPRKAQACDK
jgi:hypothetical protein